MLDNNYFSFSIHILIFVLANFNCCAYISIFHGLISRLIFVLLSLCVCCFYWTVNMSYFSLSFSLCYFQFFEPRGIIFLTIFLYKITIAILPYTIFYYYYVIKPASFLVGFSLNIFTHTRSTSSNATYVHITSKKSYIIYVNLKCL